MLTETGEREVCDCRYAPETYVCETCKRLCCWCFGNSGDEMEDSCCDCWCKENQRQLVLQAGGEYYDWDLSCDTPLRGGIQSRLKFD